MSIPNGLKNETALPVQGTQDCDVQTAKGSDRMRAGAPFHGKSTPTATPTPATSQVGERGLVVAKKV